MRKRSALTGFLTVLVLIAVTVFISDTQSADRTIIRVKGSNIMAAAVDRLAKAFTASNPDYTVVVSGGATQAGFDALLKGSCEITPASRKITTFEMDLAKQRELRIGERLVGHEGIGIIVNPKNPVKSLTMDQVRSIFTGKYSVWSQVGGPETLIILFSTKLDRSGTAVFFKSFCLKGAKIAGGTNTKYYFDHVIREVAQTDEAIGYCPFVKAIPAEVAGKIRMLSLKKDEKSPAVVAAPATVEDGSYPLIMPLYFYYIDSPGGKVARVVDYCAREGLKMY
jgi:phosphate transport system substrate-binding protein